MDRQQRLALVLLASLAITLPACAGRTPLAYLGAGQMLPATPSDTAPDRSNVHVASLPQPPQAGPALGQRAPAQQGPRPNFVSVVKQAGQSISSALTIKPKVIPADDPISLSSDPGPIDAELYISAGRIHEQHGNFQAAKDQYRRALNLEPRNLKALLSYGRIFDRLEQFDQAVAIYRRAVAAHPNNAVALNDLGLCYARQGKLQRSMQILRRAVQLDPEKKLYRNNLATVLVETGRIREAYDQLAAVLSPAAAHYNLGYFLYRRGEHPQAIEHFAQAVRIDPTLTAARRMLVQLGALPPANRHSNVAEDRSKEVQADFHTLANCPQESRSATPGGHDEAAQSALADERPDEHLAPCQPARLLSPLHEDPPEDDGSSRE